VIDTIDIFGNPIIDSFHYDYRFLSNFYPAKVSIWGIDFATSEHAYQWAKTFDENEKFTVLFKVKPKETPDGVAQIVPTTAAQAKRAGDKVTKRSDWEEVRYGIMLEVLLAKFTQNADLRALLLATGDSLLVEGNTWHDNTWGVCTCPECGNQSYNDGLNLLGKALMHVRQTIRDFTAKY
jgi:ribA/ribD-fused uncharacterized protein